MARVRGVSNSGPHSAGDVLPDSGTDTYSVPPRRAREHLGPDPRPRRPRTSRRAPALPPGRHLLQGRPRLHHGRAARGRDPAFPDGTVLRPRPRLRPGSGSPRRRPAPARPPPRPPRAPGQPARAEARGPRPPAAARAGQGCEAFAATAAGSRTRKRTSRAVCGAGASPPGGHPCSEGPRRTGSVQSSVRCGGGIGARPAPASAAPGAVAAGPGGARLAHGRPTIRGRASGRPRTRTRMRSRADSGSAPGTSPALVRARCRSQPCEVRAGDVVGEVTGGAAEDFVDTVDGFSPPFLADVLVKVVQVVHHVIGVTGGRELGTVCVQ